MKKITLLVAILFLSAMWVVAQTGATSPSTGSSSAGQSASSPDQSAPGSSASADQGMGSKSKIQGCLSGSAGNYTLTDASGKTYTITGDSSKLADNVNKEVELTGKAMESSASSASSPSSAASPSGASSASAQFEASKVKKISDSCSAAKSK
jgi:hypothetical protein